MKTLLTKKTIIIASASVIVAIITIISVNVFNSPGPVTGVANAVTRPVRALASTVANIFETIYASIYKFESLMNDYEEVMRRIVEYEANVRDATEIAEENIRLREMLDFRQRHPDYDHEMVQLKNWGSDNWSSSFEIDMGYMNSAIEVGYGVATEYGVLIGQVAEVRATTSIVITILDTTFSAAAVVGEGSGGATVKGDFMFMRNGLLVLDHIDDDLIVIPGAYVATSGLGGVFPAGLIVGEIVEVSRHTSGIGRYATVKPVREIDTISTVFVITNFERAG